METIHATRTQDDLQTLLDRRGTVRFPSGTFEISHPLIMHDDTHLILQSDTVLRVADGANCSILDNDGLYERRTNRNLTIEGGIFDGNHDHQSRKPIPNETRPADSNEDKPCDEEAYVSNVYLVLTMRLVHTENLTLKNVTFKDPTTYAVQIADVKYFHVENVTFDYDLTRKNMDGIHVQGPARYGRIVNVRGNCNDDHIALCANGTIRSEITRGAIEDVDIDGLYCSNGYTGVRLLSRGDPVRNVSIRNVHGSFRFYAVSFTHHYPLHENKPVLLENIHVSDAFVSKSAENTIEEHAEAIENGALFWFESGINARNVTIENVYRAERCPFTKAPAIRISKGANVSGLRIANVNQSFVGEPVEAVENLNRS